MLKLTVDPDPGYAVKEIFYTYNPTLNNLYAIFPKYPDNRKLVLKDVAIPFGTKISILSTKENLQWKQSGANVEINLPDYNPNKIKSVYAYALKIEDFGKFASKPQIRIDYSKDPMKPTITMSSDGSSKISFTTDGSKPTRNSLRYAGPLVMDKTTVINAIAFAPVGSVSPPPIDNVLSSSVSSLTAHAYSWMKAIKPPAPKPGIAYNYYEPTGKINLSSINGIPTNTGITDVISNSKKQRTDKFAFEFTGYIKIDKDGVYTFYIDSDDGSMLYIDDEEIVNNDGDHGNVEKSGKAALKKGFHKTKVLYFDSGGGNSLKVSMQPENGKKEVIPASILFH